MKHLPYITVMQHWTDATGWLAHHENDDTDITPRGWASKLHRIGGPAVEYRNGSVHWYFKGDSIHKFEDYCELVKPYMSEEDYFIMLLTYGNS